VNRMVLVLLGAVVLMTGSAVAQGPDTIWTRTYGGGQADAAYDVHKEGPEMTLVGMYDGDAAILALQGAGDTMWVRSYGGGQEDVARGIMWSPEGFFMGGWTKSFGAGGADAYLLATTQQGDTMWSRTFGGSQDDGIEALARTMEETPMAAGWTESFGAGDHDMWVLRFGPGGDTMWSRTFGGSDWDAAYDIVATPDDGHIIVGGTESFGAGGMDVWILKVNQEGDTMWTKTFGGPGDEVAYSIMRTMADDFVVVGYTSSFGAGDRDVWVLKMSQEGDTFWTMTIGTAEREEAYAVAPTMDEAYAVVGMATTGSDTGAYFVKLTNTGERVWAGSYGNASATDKAYAIAQTDEQYYVIAGHTMGASMDMYIFSTEFVAEAITEQRGVRVALPGATLSAGAVLVAGDEAVQLLDVTGSRVADLVPGQNDIRHLNPGVYYVAPLDGGRPGQKLLLVR